ncbi:MAG: hypothetical protein NUV81_00910 [bacterium]|nr:hypothetical protein [bacterium]
MTFSEKSIRDVTSAFDARGKKTSDSDSKVTVHAAIRRVGFLYERIRNAVEYRDDHLLRKGGIERMLKRLLLLESNPDALAEKLVRELVSARYIPDGEIPESVLTNVADCIRKYHAVARVNNDQLKHLAWIRGVVAVEIEELLVDHTKQKAVTAFLFEKLIGRIHVHGMDVPEDEQRIQLYIACERSLWKSDAQILSFKLLRVYLPEWMRSEEWIHNPRPIAERLIALQMRIERTLTHPLHQRFLRVVRPWAVSLSMLDDVLKDYEGDSARLFATPEELDRRISDKADASYKAARGKLRRGTVRAIIYLFLTKMVFALVLEVPLENALIGHVDQLALAVNLLFPPVLMFFVGLLIRVPGVDNTERLVLGVRQIMDEDPIPVAEIRIAKKKGSSQRIVFTLIYIATYLLSFGLVVVLLNLLDFTFISITIFLFFLSVVSFFGFRLRRTAREVVVVEGRQGTLSILMDFVSLPVLRAGHWLSQNMNRINVFLFVFDFLIEAPFKMFLIILEEWFGFMKEKKEELG